MKSGLVPFLTYLFTWNRNMSNDDVFIRGMMLFNGLFFLMQFDYVPQLFLVLQMLVALFFLRFINLRGMKQLSPIPLICFTILMIWTLFICRNSFSSIRMFTHFLFLPYNYICLLMPFIVIPFARLENISKYLDFVLKLIKLSLYLLLFLSPYMIYKWHGNDDDMAVSRQLFEVINLYLNGGLMFAMLMQRCLNDKERKLVGLAAFISLFCAAYFARRGVLLSYVITYGFMLLINLHFLPSRKKIYNFIKYGVILLIIISFVLVFGESLFSVIMGRIEDDTRSIVELELLDQMNSTGDMMTGRGFAGSYYSEFVDALGIEREGIETGYLHLILKGGIVYLILMSLTFIPAVFMGFFKSNNYYMKIFSCFALIFIVFFNVANSNITFSIRYFLFLIVVHILYNPKYRRMTDGEVEEYLLTAEGQ